MKLARRLAIVILALFAGAVHGAETEEVRVAQSRPSLLLVTLDTTRADRIGAYGYAPARTPRLDALSDRGALFLDAHAHVPLTLPSHATILTGRLHSTLNVRVNGLRLSPEATGLAEALSAEGYDTGAVVASVVLDESHGLAGGFRVYDDAMTLKPRGGGPPEERRAEEVTERALALVGTLGRPFFLWVHYYDPHFEYRPPREFEGGRNLNPYDGEIAYMDAMFGRLLDGVRDLGLRDEDLLLVVAGDHGESLMEFGERQHGVFLYEPSMHVPMWMSWKGRIEAGKTVEGICGLSDLAPTIADLMGFDLEEADGRSLADALASGRIPDRMIYIESYHGFFSYGWAPLRGIMNGTRKYIEAPRPEFYAWRVSERDNLLGREKTLVRAFREELGGYPEADEGERKSMERLFTDPSNAETIAQLMSLGYLSGRSISVREAGLLDPKDAIAFEEDLRVAKDLEAEGKIDEAVGKLKAVLKQNPQNLPALTILGNIYLRRGDYDAARACFEAAVWLKPQSDAAHVNLAAVYRRKGDMEKAKKEYRAALAANPRQPEAASKLAKILIGEGRAEEARRVIGRVLDAGGESSDVYFEQGILAVMVQDWERARLAFTRSVSMDPLRHEALANLGRIAFLRGEIDESIRRYERAARIAPGKASYSATLGSLYLAEKGDHRAALAHYRKALAADPYGKEADDLRQIVREIEALSKQN